MKYITCPVTGSSFHKILEKWLGVTTSITKSVLYRSKDHFGLSLKQLTDMFKCLQVSKAHYMLKTSADPKIREVYKHREYAHRVKKRWDYTKELTEISTSKK
jgi:hypothetical protein